MTIQHVVNIPVNGIILGRDDCRSILRCFLIVCGLRSREDSFGCVVVDEGMFDMRQLRVDRQLVMTRR